MCMELPTLGAVEIELIALGHRLRVELKVSDALAETVDAALVTLRTQLERRGCCGKAYRKSGRGNQPIGRRNQTARRRAYMNKDRKDKTSIALKYDGNGAPTITATGRGCVGEEIIELAHKSNVPIVEDAKLVSLLAKVPLGEETRRNCIEQLQRF